MRKLLYAFLLACSSNGLVFSQGGNTCATAVALTVNGACGSGSISDGTVTTDGYSCTGTISRETWYKFTIGSTTNITIVGDGNNRNIALQLLSGACGSLAEVACDNTTTTNGTDVETIPSTSLVAGTYFVKVLNVGSNDLTLNSLCITSAAASPANSTCATAAALPCASGVISGTTVGTTNITHNTGCSMSNFGVWYTFTGNGQQTTITTNPAFDIKLSVASGSCGSLTNIVCNDASPETTTFTTVSGVNYYVYIAHWSSGSTTTGTFTISRTCTAAPAAPANDNCGTATAFAAIPTNGSTVCINNQSTSGATASGVTPTGACTSNAGTPDDDIWFSFVATTTTHILSATYDSGSSSDIYWHVFSGACAASMTSILCTDNNSGGTITGLTIGNTYRIRMYSYYAGDNSQYDLCLSSPPPPPANDNCAGAIGLTVNPNQTCTTQTAGTINSATASGTALGACSGTADDDVWYSFVATGNTHYVSLNNVAGSTSDMYFSVHSGACASLSAAIICSDPNSATVTGLTSGTTYRVRVYSYTSTTGQTSTFDMCIGTPPPPPANDNCAGSVGLTVNSGITCTSQTAGSVTSATSSGIALGTCGGTADDDVWFNFTATSTAQTVGFNNATGSTTDFMCSVYSGACGSLNQLTCFEDYGSGETTLTALTVGVNYKVRMFSWASTAQNASFNVCVTTPPPPPVNTNCSGVVPFCPANPVTIPGSNSSNTAQAGNNYGCLGSQPNPYWYYFTANQNGNINLDLNAPSDVDFALWGPYNNVAAANAACGSYPAPIDCSYSTAGLESIDAAGATIGQVFVLLVTNYANVSQNISLSFDNPSSTGDCDCVPLPVELTSFTVSKFGEKNYINWQTASEKDNDYFLVQRSKDGSFWETIKLVKGHGTTSAQRDYQYIDENPLVGLSYYRLKQVDYNGEFVYSDVKTVTRSTFVDHYIYPQPAQKEFKISAEIGKINSIEIIDLIGKKSSVDFIEENNEYVVNIENLNSGIYIVNMISTFGIMSEKIIIR